VAGPGGSPAALGEDAMTSIPNQACQIANLAVLAMSVSVALCAMFAVFWRRLRAFITEHWMLPTMWLCLVLYWLSGIYYMKAHTYGGSYIGFRALDTPMNRYVAGFYRPWFIIFFGCNFHKEPVEFWDHL